MLHLDHLYVQFTKFQSRKENVAEEKVKGEKVKGINIIYGNRAVVKMS